MGKQDITTLSQEELAQAVKAMGVPAFRAIPDYRMAAPGRFLL